MTRITNSHPVKSGDWVEGDNGQVAKVKASYWSNDQFLVDLVLFDQQGNRVGRLSPAMNGPKKFEPACEYFGHWKRISKPSFPITLRWVPQSEGIRRAQYTTGAKLLPDRQWIPQPVEINNVTTDSALSNMPEQEIACLRRAAQELRDTSRKVDAIAARILISRAVELEQEATAISGSLEI